MSDARAALADALMMTDAVPMPDGWPGYQTWSERILDAVPNWRLVPAAAVPVDAERLAVALHYAMCDVSHHDGGPMGTGCHNWPKYPAIVRTVMRALAPAPSEHRVVPAMRNGLLRHPPICVNCGQPITCPRLEWQHVAPSEPG